MASLKLGIFFFLLCLRFEGTFASAFQKCKPLRDGPLAKCSLAGYNYTFPIPQDLSRRSITSIKAFVDFLMTAIKNCSAGRMAETMACSFLAPYCKESSSKPFLPCRRVCSEFLKRCEGSLPDFLVDTLVALCSMLQNSTASQGTCYEPPQFHTHYNSSSMGPLERSCEPVIVPFCQGIGYEHTILTHERQKLLYKHMYRKNYTNDASVSIPTPNSGAERLVNLMKNFSKCSTNIKKLFCAEYLPPCFAHEGIAFYTACKDVCRNVSFQCPELFDTPLRFFFYCEKLAFGEPYNGFCKHTSWPPPMKWIDIFKVPPKKTPKPKGGVGGGVIAVVIIIPVVIVGTVIGLVFFYKKRKVTSPGYSRQEDDRDELVT